jgi:hypothetical protein
MNALPVVLACALAFVSPSLRAADLVTSPDAPPLRTAAQLQELVAPIALYPDPLVALILPAATFPTEVVLAWRFLERGGNAETATRENWDDSVKALTRYREVLEYLDQNLDWTRSLGAAFLDQPSEVMDAIQAVRARARANGLLADTREQIVYLQQEEIFILPASPHVIYIPRYNPGILHVSSRPSSAFWLTFGVGYGVGSWLNHDCDWRYRSVRVLHRPPHWYHAPDWRPSGHSTGHAWHRWTPSPEHVHRRDQPGERPRTESLRPRPDRDDTARRLPNRFGDRRADNTPPSEGEPSSDDQRRSSGSRRHRDPGPAPSTPFNAPTMVSTPPAGPTAASVASTAPLGPSAPVMVSTPPSAPAPTLRTPRPPHDERERDFERRQAPRTPRHSDGERTYRPESAPTPVPARPPRSEPISRPAPAARSEPSLPRAESFRPPAVPSAGYREERSTRDGERHPTPDEREPR